MAAVRSPASTPTEAAAEFEAANKLYEQGKFLEAGAGFQKLVEAGAAAPALYFNLGNAMFKSGQIGRSIGAYERARALSPRDSEVQANLQFVRNQVQGPTSRPNTWEQWLRTLNLNEWTWLACSAVWGTFLLLAAMQLRPSWKTSWRNSAIALGCAAVVLCGCLGLALLERSSNTMAIVAVHDLTVRTGPFEGSQSAFVAHDGAEFRVVDHRDDWYQVSDGAGRIGWVRIGDVVLSRPI